MGGRVFFTFLSEANGIRLHLPIEETIDKDIMAQKIPTDNEYLLKQHGEDAVLSEIPINAQEEVLEVARSLSANKEEHEPDQRRDSKNDELSSTIV